MDRVAKASVPTGLLLGDAGSREIPAPFFVYDEEKVQRKSNTCPTKLFIGGISRHTTTKQLRDHFSQYGEVLDCIAMRAGDGRPRGFGYVTLDSPAAAQRVLYEPQLVDNRIVDVKLAVPENASSPKNAFGNQGCFSENMLSKYGFGAWAGADALDAQTWWPNCPAQMAAGQYEQGLDCLQILSQTRESGTLSAGAPEFVPQSELTSPEATPTSRSEAVGQQRAPLGEITNIVKVDDPIKAKPLTIKTSQEYLKVPISGDSNLPANDVVGIAVNMDSMEFRIHEDSPDEVLPSRNDNNKSDLLLSPLPASEEAQPEAIGNDGSEASEASDPSIDNDDISTEENVSSANLEDLPSIGSALHFSGECKRCNFFAKGRCQNGKACSFCHFQHEVRKLTRQEKRERRGSKLQELTKDIDEKTKEQKAVLHHQRSRPESLTATLFMNDQDDDAIGDETYAYSMLPGLPPINAMKLPTPLQLPGMDMLSQASPALPPGLLPPGLAAPRSSFAAKDQTTPEFLQMGASKASPSSLLSTTPSSSLPLASTSSLLSTAPSSLLSTMPSPMSLSSVETQNKTVTVRTIGTQTDEDYTCPRCEKRVSNLVGDASEKIGEKCCNVIHSRC
jgi:hypothetical protein